MGFAGGLVPSPSALVVLLGAIALGRAWFGLVLVVAYGLGMAGMLTGAGLLLVRARRLLERRARQRPGRLVTIAHLLPTATAVLIVIVGVVLASRGVAKI
jgi:nickel/cobalt exporter